MCPTGSVCAHTHGKAMPHPRPKGIFQGPFSYLVVLLEICEFIFAIAVVSVISFTIFPFSATVYFTIGFVFVIVVFKVIYSDGDKLKQLSTNKLSTEKIE